ncbi:MAG: isopentenyl-diphosphate Delta-isomerase [Corynebacterium sp.]|nr:isopentenyl-diphosphate Delta-isomerase [Corynebacterium sp.]
MSFSPQDSSAARITPSSTEEQVVLLNAAYEPIGTYPKASVHTKNTPLHLAFSCYIIDDAGDLIITRRALTKVAWPGVWTNSVCGHISPGETPEAAIRRRIAFELGLPVAQQGEIREVLANFEYYARDDSGVVEWEFCPVYVMNCTQPLDFAPNRAEVARLERYPFEQVLAAVQATPAVYSPWMVSQLAHSGLVQALREVSAR